MIRSKRKRVSADHFRSGLSVLALVGLLLGVAAGISAVSSNALVEKGLTNLALSLFVEKLNLVFFRFVLLGVPVAVVLYLLYRIAPRAFRAVASVLFFVFLAAAAVRHPFFSCGAGPFFSVGASALLGVGRNAILLFACLVAARVFHEAFPVLGAVIRAFALRFVVVILFLLAAANSAAYINYTKNFPRGANVVLITTGSIRPDHLGAYGYLPRTSPNFDRLAAEGILFSRAFTVTPREQASLAAILTGRTPDSNGVRRAWDPLPSREVTLAEILSDRGYMTGAFVSLSFPQGKSGLEQGFDTFDESPGEADRTDQAIRWMGSRKKRPFFAWIHYPDASMPFAPPEEDRLFGDPSYRGAYREEFDYRPTRGCRVFDHEILTPADAAQALALYDGEIHSVDREIGRIVGHLETTDKIHDTLIIVIGAQGESLGEHGYFYDHGEFLYDESIRVPLVVRAANLPRLLVANMARSIDILPLVIDVLHLGPAPGTEGRSLMGAIERPDDFVDLPLIAQSGVTLMPRYNGRRPVEGLAGRLFAVRKGGWKLIRTPGTSGAREELYDVEADPDETMDLAAEGPEACRELATILDRRTAGAPIPSAENEGPPPNWVRRMYAP